MLACFQKILESFNNLRKDRVTIIGFSGGPDSLTLLDIMLRLDYSVVVGHLNHSLRPEASEDAREAERIAVEYGAVFEIGINSVLDHAQKKHLSIEEAGRDLRYQFLYELASQYDAQAVAVGHNANDQAETVLMHLMRGAGLDGLTGMQFYSLPNPWSKIIPLIRPLLGFSRVEIEAYCEENNLAPLIDSSNTDTHFLRNKIRQELIPEIERYMPGFQSRLFQTSDLLNADRQVLDDVTLKLWGDLAQEYEGYIQFNHISFNSITLGLQRRIIRKAISQLRPGGRDVDYAFVERAINFARNPTKTGKADLGLGLRISHEKENLVISDWDAVLPVLDYPQLNLSIKEDSIRLPVPGEIQLRKGWILKLRTISNAESAIQESRQNQDPCLAWIDPGEREPIFSIRTRSPGDRFHPLGMDGKSMKLSDFMINQKVPRRARASFPLVCHGHDVVWVPGLRLSHLFRVRRQSRNIIKLILIQN